MATIPITISQDQYYTIIAELNIILHRLIIDDVFEYEYIIHSFTPRIRVNLRENLDRIFLTLFNGGHPIITKSIVNTIIISLDSAIYALFSIRNKSTFTPVEIKDYLCSHLKWLLDIEEHYPSLLGNYMTISHD
jgi:hypothetical protein